tara:strand:+ start:12964 stop:13803 length:840 start_codon:yes stop_codon:yes gene_type:complete
MNDKSVNIIVLNWNQKKLSLECLNSLENTTYKNKHIVFVDNGSDDGSVEAVRNLYPKVEIIRSEKNLGYAGGNNLGFTSTKNKADYTIFINNDTYVDSSFIEPLIYELEKEPSSIQTVPKIFFADKKELIWYAGGNVNLTFAQINHRGIRSKNNEKYNHIRQVGYATGCCFSIRTSDFKTLGMFDENFQMYGEDVDLSLKVRRGGGNITFVPKSQVWHHISSSMGGRYSFFKWKKKYTSIFKLILKYSNPIFFPITIVLFLINAFLNFILLNLLKIFNK